MARAKTGAGRKRPSPPDPFVKAIEDLLDDVLAFNATTMDLLYRFDQAKSCCAEDRAFDEIEQVRAALREITQAVLDVRTETVTPKNAGPLLWDVSKTLTGVRLPRGKAGDGMPTRVPIADLLLTASGNPMILATSRLPIPAFDVSPQDAAAAINALKQLLERMIEVAREEGSSSIFEIERELQAIINSLDGWLPNQTVRLADLMRFLREKLLEALRILRDYGFKGTPFIVAIRQSIARFLVQIQGYIIGQAGSVAAETAIRLGVYALAFYVGHLIGKWIGKKVVGGKTVNEWLEDAIYYEYFAISDDCLDLEAAWYAARKLRRDYEHSGTTLDKSVMLDLLGREYSALFKLRETAVRKHCFDDVSHFDKELERLKKRYRELAPAWMKAP
ncbi:MAG TPA: hypothetical protein VFK79_15215 [Xanthobacteraceae bacterium]|nr:hypothetical protein [Xanthobacteraceae bacterium]